MCMAFCWAEEFCIFPMCFISKFCFKKITSDTVFPYQRYLLKIMIL